MPPFRRFWPYYTLIVIIALGLGLAFYHAFRVAQSDQCAAFILASGVVVAFVSILATSLSTWRSSRIQQTFSAVQTLRTDREYLINALRVEAQKGVTLGKPLTPELITEFKTGAKSSDVDKPSFGQASRFVLNQYEFIAAAARLGQLDEEMLRNSIRAAFGTLVQTFAPVIRERRLRHPETMSNLVWLYQRFYPDRGTDLGPPPILVSLLWRKLGWFFGTRPLGC